MKKLLSILLFASSLAVAQTDLIISEYVEGSGVNCAIELYNGTSNPITLSGYSIGIYYNGQNSAGQSWAPTPSATIAAGDVYVLVHSSASETLRGYADQLNGNTFDGNDALVLTKNGTPIDVIGQVGFNPGAGGWSSGDGLTTTKDHTLRRKVGIITGDSNPNDAFDPSIEWDVYPIDTFDGLGNLNNPLPVELTIFSASFINKSVELTWETATEVNNYGFEIERCSTSSATEKSWEKINFIEGHGNSNSPKYYSFTDENINSGKYLYRLKQIDIDGKFEYSKVIEIEVGIPKEFIVQQNYPNPFNPNTTIEFSLPQKENVSVVIYNMLGEVVKTLANGILEAGKYQYDFSASQISSGTYIYKVTAGSNVSVKKMIVLK